MLYTIINEADIFHEEPHPRSYRCYGRLILEGTRSEKGFQIQRIISTNPADYLNKAWTSGGVYQPNTNFSGDSAAKWPV